MRPTAKAVEAVRMAAVRTAAAVGTEGQKPSSIKASLGAVGGRDL